MKGLKTGAKVLLGLIGVALVAAGVICLISPFAAATSVFKIIGVVLIATGALTGLFFFLSGSFLVFSWMFLVNAVFDIVTGLIFCTYSDTAATIFAVLFGILLIVVGLGVVPVSFLVKKLSSTSKFWLVALVAGLVFLVCGFLSVSHPTTFGITLIAIPIGLAFILVGAIYLFIIKSISSGSSKFVKASAAPATDDTYYKDVD